jgi:general stress protein 26
MTHHTDSQTAWSLIEKISLCMLVTHDGGGDELRARPMSAHARPDEGAIYFLTDARNHKDNEIEINENVCLAFADTGGQKYVSVTGIANVSSSREMIDELWSTPAKAWWDSKDDPNIRVLRVMPTQAEYWDGPGSIVTLVKMLAAAVTGGRPELGENRKVTL